MFEELRRFCDSFLEAGFEAPGFDLVIFERGKCVLRYRNGYSDLENRIPMSGKERFNIYSCSKVITVTAAMRLWEKGLFSLEDRLSRYMPEFEKMYVRTAEGVRPAEKPILIRHLFEMTAGFSYDTETQALTALREDTGGRCPTREAMKYLAQDPLLFEPGEGWKYGLSHDVLAALVEVLADERFEEHIRRTIFEPTGMPRSTFLLPEEELKTVAPQYRFQEGKAENIGPQISKYKLGSEYASGGAGAVSTVDEYIRFLEGLRTGAFLKPETVALMTKNRLTPAQTESYHRQLSSNRHHGYGLGLRTPGPEPVYSDFGWAGAAGAFLAIEPEKEMSMYFGTHFMSSPFKKHRPLLFRLARAEMFDPADLAAAREEIRSLSA